MDPNVLRECTQRLLETAEFIRNVGNNNSTGVNTQTTTASSTTASTSHPRLNSTPTDGRAQDSFKETSTTVCLATAYKVRVERDNRVEVQQVAVEDPHAQSPL